MTTRTFMIRLICVAMLGLAPTAQAQNQTHALAVLGSSTAAGTGASQPNKSWAGLLQAWLASNKNTSLLNLAEPGALTSTALCSPNTALQAVSINKKNVTSALAYGASKLIVAFPSNDATHGFSAEQTLKNMREIRNCAKNSNARVAVMSSLPRSGLTEQQNVTIAQIDNALAKEFGACFIQARASLTEKDNLNAKAELSMGDGVHFNDAGHAVIFNVVKNFLESGKCF